MPESETKKIPALDSLPDLQGGKMPPIDPKLADETVQTVLKGGKDAIIAIIDLLRETDDGTDWKARFLLQALVIAVGNPGQDATRQTLAAILLDESIGSRPVPVRIFLLARLRFIATNDMTAKLTPLAGGGDPRLADAAAAVLATI